MDIHKTYIWSDGPHTEYEVTGLQTAHIYQFRVYAQNEAGRGEALLNKNVIRIKVATKKPLSPSKPSAVIQDDESVLLEWTIPEGFSDVNYIIERYESKSDLWMQCNHEIVIRKSYLVTGLTAGKEYKFRVTCENIHGVSAPSKESDPVILQDDEGEPPTVITSIADCFVKVDDSASFSCEYSGTQPILVNWSKDGIRVREGFGATVTTEMTKTTLMLEDVESDDDECSVQCDLRNSEGKASSEAKIKILSPPKINCPSAYKEGLTYDEGDNMRIKITFVGKPLPKVVWLFNGNEPILDDRVEVTLQSQFVEVRISELKHTDAGSYEFVAENEVGKDRLAVDVTVTGPPSSPSGLPSMEVINEDEVLLKWKIPLDDGGSSIFNYIVEILKPENEEWEHFASIHDNFMKITDITLAKTSLFRVKAINIYGASEPSMECQLYKTTVSDTDLQLLLDRSSQKDNEVEVTESEDVNTEKGSPLLLGDISERNAIKLNVKEIEDNKSKKEQLLADKNESCADKITTVDYEICSISDMQDYSDLADEMQILPDLEFSFGLPVCAEKNEILNMAATITELQECELVSPLKILYVGTQTLILMPILNYACSDVHDFDEITYFAREVMPLEDYLVQSIDHILNYTICWFTTILENAVPAEFLLTGLAEVLNCAIQSYDSSLQSYLPYSYDCEAVMHNFKLSKDKASYVENYTNMLNIEEKVCIDFSLSKPPCMAQTNSVIQRNYGEAIMISLHPWTCEYFLPFISDTIFKHNLTAIKELHHSISVFQAYFLYSPTEFQIGNKMERAVSVTHIADEFETLAGVKCVPLTSCKPALSVLPMTRTTEPNREHRSTAESNISSSLSKSLNRIFSQCSFGLVDKNLSTSNICIKCGSTTCLCNLLDNSNEFSYLINNDILVNNIELHTQKEFDKEEVPKTKVGGSELSFASNIPEWLRFVSPLYLPSNEEGVNETNFEFGNKISSQELTVERETRKICFKDRSVQELLDLAEEVERSFAQKAEHIESLENVLQEELNSLEHDLEAVHKIHQSLWDEDKLPYIASTSCFKQDTKSFSDVKSSEKDLIDFQNDIPFTKSPDIKQDEYAPEVVTHLQNRIVQCGCRTRLYCSISGKPDPQIAWLKNGKLLSHSSRYICSNLVEFGLYVDIFNAKSSDSGEYMCIATNCHGSAQTQAYLSVVGHREYSPEEPRFLASPDDITITEGESVTLEWKIAGTPVPLVMWFKNAEKIQTGLRIDALSNHRGRCRLVLHNLRTEDSAIYTCYLENEAGSSVSTVLVSVTDGLNQCCEESLDVHSTLNSLISFTTEDTSIPSLQYYERLLNRPKTSPLAGTSVKAKTRTQNRTRKVPGPPFAPYILNSGKTWVILSWSSPTDREGKTSGLIYLVERRLLDGDQWKEVGRTRSTLFTASSLKSGQSYVFRIAAGNSDGWGPPVMLTQPFHCGRDTRPKTNNSDQIY